MPEGRSLEVLEEEFLVAGNHAGLAAIQAVLQVSPLYIDDNTQNFGVDVYERMMKDDDVSSNFETRILSVCSEGARVQPARGADKKNPKDIKNIYAAFMERCIDGMESDLTDVALELMHAKALGSKMAEMSIGVGVGEDVGRWMPKGVYVRDSKDFNFLLDKTGKLAGVIPIAVLTEKQRKALEKESAKNDAIDINVLGLAKAIVPRWKVIHFVNDPKNGKITGNSILRAAYTPWFIKTQLLPEFFKYLKQFASPSVLAKLPKPSDDVLAMAPTEEITDADGSKRNEQKAKILLDKILAWQNAYALVVKGGTEVDLMTSEGDGAAYRHALDYFGRQIAQVILGTSQVTKEAQHESKSSKGVAQDVVGLRIANDRRRLSNCFTNDFSKNIIRLNFGDAAVKHAPSIVFTNVEQHDRLQALDSYSSAYAKGFVQDEQLDDIYDELGMPAMPDGWLEEKKTQQELARKDSLKAFDPQGIAGQ